MALPKEETFQKAIVSKSIQRLAVVFGNQILNEEPNSTDWHKAAAEMKQKRKLKSTSVARSRLYRREGLSRSFPENPKNHVCLQNQTNALSTDPTAAAETP